ncbi:sulfurtransferase TusA family protein [Sutcliffiella deserti]|uniref:sulfurtransferase TusA family protein n=1 Tax=Sutcliffiella deserti TaxID=2875501 RepID=UPI001CC16483|nr:sulfurtransferase TusA family protein [Sutcliffiella deserti]
MKVDLTLDAKGLACPMPIVRTKKSMEQIEAGEVLEVIATDKGSKADIAAWAEKVGHQYLGTKEEDDLLKHYIRKARSDEEKAEQMHPHVTSNEELQARLQDEVTIIDVREPAEYAFGHIPGAISIPLGELEEHVEGLDKTRETFIVCRTGSRSDLAAQKLTEKGFSSVFNVIPGMSQWNGPTA